MQVASSNGKNVSIVSLTNTDDIERMRSVWEKLQWHPNADIDFFLTIISVRKNVIRPHVIVVSHDDAPVAMAVARIDRTRINCSIGYKTLFSLRARSLTLLNGGILGSDQYSQELLDALLEVVRQGDADVLLISQTPCNSAFWTAAKQTLRKLLSEQVGPTSLHWKLDVSEPFEGFLSRFNSKQRRDLLNPRKLIERNFENQFEYKCYSDPEDIARVVEEAEQIQSGTYHRGLGVGFVNDEEHSRRLRLEAETGRLRVYFLYLEDKPVAFWMCTLYKSVLHLGYTGYISDYRKYHPGMALLLYMVEDGCSSEAIHELDFGEGDADYKRKFTDQNFEQENFRVYSYRPWGVVLFIARLLPATLERMARACLSALGLEKRIKRWWRDRLAKKATQDND